MKKRRERKLETRLKEMGHGGSLKIYGGELVPSRPYVTILVSMYDRAEKILAEALEKYGIDPINGNDYVLVEMPVSEQTSHSFNDLRNLPSDGRVIDADEAPLMQMASKGNGYPETYLALRRKQNRGARAVIQDHVNSVSEPVSAMTSSSKEPSLHFLAPGEFLSGRPYASFVSLTVRA
ncbi:Ras association domain protein [Cooperia oncophora]